MLLCTDHSDTLTSGGLLNQFLSHSGVKWLNISSVVIVGFMI